MNPPAPSPTGHPVRVTDHYGITGTVPFVDVAVHQDNLLFLDPSAIRNDPGPLGRRAHAQLLGFFGEVLRCRTSTVPADHAKGRALLQNLHEPNQTRLGMSAAGAAGHGLGDGIGAGLWDELHANPACGVAALTRIEDLRLFVDGIGDDLVSDLTTRIVFDVLVDFTHQMMLRYPTLTIGQSTEDVDVWDHATTRWVSRSVTLPYVHPHQLLLVPRRWIWWRMLMDPNVFYNRYGTETVQAERTTVDSKGRILRPSKASLHQEFPHVRGLNNERAVKHMRAGEDLVGRYRQRVDGDFHEMTAEQVKART